MGLFDIFGTGDQHQAAQDQINALTKAQQQGSSLVNQGLNTANATFTTGTAPLNKNFAVQSAGQDQLAALLGIGGNPQSVQDTLKSLPGYQFQLGQGMDNVLRANAAQGYGAGPNGGLSGNTDVALANYVNGLTGTNYNNYVSQLQPFLGASTTTGGQIATTATNQANLQNQDFGKLADMAYGTNVGIGNANASADLSGLNASANGIGAIMNLAKLRTGGGTTLGGDAIGALFGML